MTRVDWQDLLGLAIFVAVLVAILLYPDRVKAVVWALIEGLAALEG